MSQSNTINILSKAQVQKNLLRHLFYHKNILNEYNQKLLIITLIKTDQTVSIMKAKNQIQNDIVRVTKVKSMSTSQSVITRLTALNLQSLVQVSATSTQTLATSMQFQMIVENQEMRDRIE